MCLLKKRKKHEEQKVPAMPVSLMLLLLGEFATPPDRTVSDIFSIWRVLAKQLCWQSVTASVWLELALCGGFNFTNVGLRIHAG